MNTKRKMNVGILEAAAALGSVSALARAMGVTTQSVYRWLYDAPTPIMALKIEQQTGVSRLKLCPEVFEEVHIHGVNE